MAHNNQEALQSLAKSLGITLDLSDDNIVDLLLAGETVTLQGDAEGTTLRINAVIGDLTDASSAGALKKLLYANFNGQGTGLNTLSLDHITDEVVLGRAVDVTHFTTDGLKSVLEDFANYLVFWRDNLKKLTDSTESSSAASDEMQAGFVRV